MAEFDHLCKLLLIGDSGVGKSCLLLRFTSDSFEDVSPTIGVDFKLKYLEMGGKKLKLTVWDTAGQERFRTLTSSYYRGAQGIIFVYDITRRETFENMSEVDMYCTVPDSVKIVIGNKLDKEESREVTKAEGQAFARAHGCLFLACARARARGVVGLTAHECSAKSRVGVQEAFQELVQRILETPSLLAESSAHPSMLRVTGESGGGAAGACGC